jgi:hypothetical protein
MKQRFRLYRRRRGGRFYIHDSVTGKQESLGTTDRAQAVRLLHSKNEAQRQPVINLQIARAYLAVSDPGEPLLPFPTEEAGWVDQILREHEYLVPPKGD